LYLYCLDPADYSGVAAVSAGGGGGAVYGVASPRRATVGGAEYRVNCGTAPAAVLQATSAGLADFPLIDNLTFTQAFIHSLVLL